MKKSNRYKTAQKSKHKPSVEGSALKTEVLDVNDLSYLAKGVARNSEGKVFFLDDALPGESVLVSYRELKSRVEVVSSKLIRTSSLRQNPVCSVYQHCGGCQLQHVMESEHLEIKMRWLESNLVRLGGQKKESLSDLKNLGKYEGIALLNKNYRQRIRLHFDGVTLGFFKKSSHEIISAMSCVLPLVPLPIDRLQMALTQFWNLDAVIGMRNRMENHILDFELTAFSIASEKVWNVSLVGHFLPSTLSKIQPYLASCLEMPFVSLGEGGTLKLAHPCTPDFSIHPQSFLQPHVNAVANYWKKMKCRLLYLCAEKKVDLRQSNMLYWDLYCGSGTWSALGHDLGAPFAASVKVIGVEGITPATQQFGANLGPWAGMAECVNSGVKEFLLQCAKFPKKDTDVSLVLTCLDPPRSGMENGAPLALMDALNGYDCAKIIIYIACDSAVLARDSKYFLQDGFELISLDLFDSFGQTVQYETIALFWKP